MSLRLATPADPLDDEERIAEKLQELARVAVAIHRKEEELSRVSGDLERFVYFASHDLKSPLRAVDSLASWIAEDLGDQLQGESKQHMALLRGRISRMGRLLDDILVYSRAGRVQVAPVEVDVRELVQGLTMLLDVPEGMTVEVDPSLPTLTTWRSLLLQVLHNLVGNAIKHHDQPSGCVRVGADALAEHYSFWVQDDGPGIDPRFHGRVFDMFQTLRRRDEVEGSGMGLALVRKIVDQVGGRVELTSGDGRGACFRFTWPRTPPPLAGK